MLYKLFSSLKTSVIILSFMCLIFLIGTIFPQGRNIEDYREAGGKYVALVRALDFLDIFMSPLFIFTTGILVINLAVCLYDRLTIFLRLKRKPLSFDRLKSHSKVLTLQNADIEERLRKTGFKLKAQTNDAVYPGVKIFEKGFQYWWLSWFYHVGIILAIFGFFFTALFAFEEGVVLYPDEPETISLYSEETRWNEFLKNMGWELPGEQDADKYILTLEEFKTEYFQGLRIDYPEDKFERLALGIGIKNIKPSKKGFSYMPKMWLTRLKVQRPDRRILDAKLWVNKPFRTSPLILYQMGYEQKMKLSVSGKIMDVEARIPFVVENVEGKFVLGSLKLGTLFKKDGTKEKIIPFATVYFIPEEDSSKREVLGELKHGSSLHVKGVEFEFKDYREGSYLSYRKDPGVWLVGLACLFVFLGLFVRSLGAWYRIQCAVEHDTAYILFSTRGILADKDRIVKKLQK